MAAIKCHCLISLIICRVALFVHRVTSWSYTRAFDSSVSARITFFIFGFNGPKNSFKIRTWEFDFGEFEHWVVGTTCRTLRTGVYLYI